MNFTTRDFRELITNKRRFLEFLAFLTQQKDQSASAFEAIEDFVRAERKGVFSGDNSFLELLGLMSPEPEPEPKLDHVFVGFLRYVSEGKKIPYIKLIRSLHGYSLREAKRLIEAIHPSMPQTYIPLASCEWERAKRKINFHYKSQEVSGFHPKDGESSAETVKRIRHHFVKGFGNDSDIEFLDLRSWFEGEFVFYDDTTQGSSASTTPNRFQAIGKKVKAGVESEEKMLKRLEQKKKEIW